MRLRPVVPVLRYLKVGGTVGAVIAAGLLVYEVAHLYTETATQKYKPPKTPPKPRDVEVPEPEDKRAYYAVVYARTGADENKLPFDGVHFPMNPDLTPLLVQAGPGHIEWVARLAVLKDAGFGTYDASTPLSTLKSYVQPFARNAIVRAPYQYYLYQLTATQGDAEWERSDTQKNAILNAGIWLTNNYGRVHASGYVLTATGFPTPAPLAFSYPVFSGPFAESYLPSLFNASDAYWLQENLWRNCCATFAPHAGMDAVEAMRFYGVWPSYKLVLKDYTDVSVR